MPARISGRAARPWLRASDREVRADARVAEEHDRAILDDDLDVAGNRDALPDAFRETCRSPRSVQLSTAWACRSREHQGAERLHA